MEPDEADTTRAARAARNQALYWVIEKIEAAAELTAKVEPRNRTRLGDER